MQAMNGIIGRRAWLAALATLSALLAVAVLALAPARAAPPDNLALSLSLVGDSDNVVPAGGNLQVAAKLSYTAQYAEDLVVTGGALRAAGGREWESNGRSSLGVEPADFGPKRYYAGAGNRVAVQERTSAEGGSIAVVGARGETVNTHDSAGAADLFVGGRFVTRLTADGDVRAWARFGLSVAVGGGYIVVGAPFEGGSGYDVNEPQGAVYVFDDTGERVARLTPGLNAGDPGQYVTWDTSPNRHPINRFGDDVAIDDAGNTIVVAAKSAKAQRNTATVFVFTKPAGGWADRSTDDNVPWLSSSDQDYRYRFAAPAGIDISADGNIIVWAFENVSKSIIAVHEKPGSGWGNLHQGFVTLDTTEDFDQHRPGESIAISDDGTTIAASGNSRWAADSYNEGSTPVGQIIANPGRAYVWERDGSTWTNHTDHDALLSDPESAYGDLFGRSVAINGDGSTVVVSNGSKSANNYAAGEAHVFVRPGAAGTWADEDEADVVLRSPQSGVRLLFGFGVALDGDTLVVGQEESLTIYQIATGHGRAFTFDISATPNEAAVQRSGAELVGPVRWNNCTLRWLDGVKTYTCDLATVAAAAINIPAGTPDGTFTISGSVTVDGGESGTDDDVTYSASLEVEVSSEPAIAAEYGGLAWDAAALIRYEINQALLSIDEGAPGSYGFDSESWVCSSRCRYLNVTWNGILPRAEQGRTYTITVARNRIPTAQDLGITDDEFGKVLVPTQMSLSISGSSTSQQYVPIPWAGETVTVTVSGDGAEASAAVKIPAPDRPAVFSSRAAADQVGATLATDPDAADLPIVMSVWRKVSGATHYEVQYTFRTRSRDEERLTKVTRIVRYSDLSDQSGDSGQYSTFSPNWDQHPNSSVRALEDSDFGENGEWMGALITLPELLAGEAGWPADALAAKTEIIAALRAGKENAVGVRVRPLAACAALLIQSDHCFDLHLQQPGVLALWGRKSKITYVTFNGANAQEWLSSAGGG